MWIMSRHGFYRVAKKPGSAPHELEVRVRCKVELVRLIHATGPKTQIIENGGTDYPFRALTSAFGPPSFTGKPQRSTTAISKVRSTWPPS